MRNSQTLAQSARPHCQGRKAESLQRMQGSSDRLRVARAKVFLKRPVYIDHSKRQAVKAAHGIGSLHGACKSRKTKR